MNEGRSPAERPSGLISAIVGAFLEGRMALLLLLAALSLGAAAILLTPREEEPQIVVPIADIFVDYPGGTPQEVERLVAVPLERLLWQVDGVEYVYSTSERDRAVVTVRFFVGEDREESLVLLYNKVRSHIDEAVPGISGWVIKPIEIDDVPIVTLALHSDVHQDDVLLRVAQEVQARLDTLENLSRSLIVGGRPLELLVELDSEAMLARGVSPLEVESALSAADSSLSSGGFDRADRHWSVRAGPFIKAAEDVAALVVGLHEGSPVYVRDIADVSERFAEPETYTRIGFGPASDRSGEEHAAVTIAVAKKKGTNAVAVANQVLSKVADLERDVIPSDVRVTVTRNSGKTANDKVNELLSSLLFAMVSVVGLLLFALGWREGLVVGLAVPMSFALALFVNYVFGYSINRVTLFALILTIGLVVDDPIAIVENIQRHSLNRTRNAIINTLYAVKEVLPPVIMSTLTIIVSFVPLFFITGMMGPYMEPMAVTVPLTVSFSTLAALSVVPWAGYHLVARKPRRKKDDGGAPPSRFSGIYSALITPFLDSSRRRKGLVAVVVLLLVFSASLVLLRQVPMKLLPFDNKSELLLVINMPEGTTLERTDAVTRDFEIYLHSVPEVTDFETCVGTFNPIDFNGLVRHYYFRSGPNVADIRINLIDKGDRDLQSHELALRMRNSIEAIAERHGARIAIVETPAGPPVLSTLVAEVYGNADTPYESLNTAAVEVMNRFAQQAGVTDLDEFAETPRKRLDFELDKEKAALHAIDTRSAVDTLRLALDGSKPAKVHRDSERAPMFVRLRFPRANRSGESELSRIGIKGADGEVVPLEELGRFVMVDEEGPIYHKNLEPVAYVVAEMAGRPPGEAVLDLYSSFDEEPLPTEIAVDLGGEGEWKITVRVFRDLGLAFGAALIGIYLLLILQTDSWTMPLLIMTAIPLTAIGIMPGFWILNLFVANSIDGYGNPVFFTATAMIGMIALGGIVVRNSIVLIDFIQQSIGEGVPIREAILESGAVRMRPILLTAATTAIGAMPITLDPIFSGLAWALIFGLLASTAFTLIVVPVGFYVIFGGRAVVEAEV